MENASKALIMAAGVLIALMVISLGVFLFITMGGYAKQVDEINRQNQLDKFNGQFLKYDSKDNVTIYDIVTITNLAKTNNENYDIDSGYYITVLFKGTPLQEKTEADLNNLISDNLNSYIGNTGETLKNYKCKVTVSTENARVKLVSFFE